ncbi:CGNR zinc finger domain-containing protein [Nocardioidaceae bacterium]|nr:CGNR zinc finger domain-containing protein [Nocardioidaceae bacterium]
MAFAHDTLVALKALEDLVNTAPHGEDPVEVLETPEDLADFLEERYYSGRVSGDDDELAAVRAMRPRLRELVLADRDDAAEIVNTMLTECRAMPQLVRHGGFDWHVHAVPADARLDRRIMVESAMAVLDVIRADEYGRMSTCDATDCSGVVIDLSRNRSRRFCSTSCGNRIAVAAYRARQAQEAG